MRIAIALSLAAAFLTACGHEPPKQQDLCEGFVCDEPPAPRCQGDLLITTTNGACQQADGTAFCPLQESQLDCTASGKLCMDGACIDACNSTVCNTPPAATCSNGVLTTYAATGTCDSSSGTPTCTYQPTSTDCTADDKVCEVGVGACVDPCAADTCGSPPADTCTGDIAHVHPNPGTCTSPGGVVACDYPPTDVDCTATDQTCDNGACVDPCVGFTCDAPPADTCSGNTLTQHANPGTCSSPLGVPACSYGTTDVDCTMTDEICQGGACVDPCVGFTCNTPPAATCVNNVARTFSPAGTCTSPGGVPACGYAPIDQDCSLSGQTCNAGACTGPVLFCRVQFPETITDVATTTQTVYGRVYVQGVTDQTGGNDINPNVKVELGLGTGNDPTAFTYTAATPNASYGTGSPNYEANNDEYQGTLVVPTGAGTTEHYGMRLSNDAGATWIYCDAGNAGSSNGFDNPGLLHIAAVYFSQYIEGAANSSNKAIEIFNPGSIAFSLTGCQIQVFANGMTTSANTNISGTTLAAGGIYTLCKTGITDSSKCSQSTGSGLWNGNDAIQLKCGATVYDVVGQIGKDPGANGWGTGSNTTTDHTLLRNCDVFAGDTDGSDAFDPASQWKSYAADTLIYLGARNCPLP
ncbi:MAG TPA: lamin tail domain-containing protein [Kofleriaceae bacterium]|nr:lamin tail domain-containing protein [Kofleriaceae bacterium]